MIRVLVRVVVILVGIAATVPIMEFQNLSDEDIVAILSFLRTQPAVHQQPQPHRLTFLGRLLLGVVTTPSCAAATPSPAGAVGPRFAGGQR